MAFLEARGIVKSYPVGGRSLTVLRDLDLVVEAGEMVAIVVCFVATIYPSRQAARLDPAQALRYE